MFSTKKFFFFKYNNRTTNDSFRNIADDFCDIIYEGYPRTPSDVSMPHRFALEMTWIKSRCVFNVDALERMQLHEPENLRQS